MEHWCNESEGQHRRTRIDPVPHCATQRYTGLARNKPEIYLWVQFLPHSKHRTFPLQRKFGWGNKRYFCLNLTKHCVLKICGQKRLPEF
jgi:hypothetical protein